MAIKSTVIKKRRGHYKNKNKMNSQYYRDQESVVGWIYKCYTHLDLHHETFHLAVHYFYTYCEQIVRRDRLQLAGMASLWIASKFEEIDTNGVKGSTLIWCADDSYNIAQLEHMEWMILNQLEWKLVVQTAVQVLLSEMTESNDDEIARAIHYLNNTIRTRAAWASFTPEELAQMTIHRIFI